MFVSVPEEDAVTVMGSIMPYTDDTAMARDLSISLLKKPDVDPVDIAKRSGFTIAK